MFYLQSEHGTFLFNQYTFMFNVLVIDIIQKSGEKLMKSHPPSDFYTNISQTFFFIRFQVYKLEELSPPNLVNGDMKSLSNFQIRYTCYKYKNT